MSNIPTYLLAGALAVTASAAVAATLHHHHHLRAPLAAYVPGEHFDYALLTPQQAAYAVPQFAGMDRMMAVMDQMEQAMDDQMQQVFAQADDMVAAPQDRLMDAVLPDTLERGGDFATLDAALKNGDACMRSVSITQTGNAKPQVVSHSYGNCGGAASGKATEAAAPALQPTQPGLIEASWLTSAKNKHKKHPA